MSDHACMIVEVQHLMDYTLNAENVKKLYMTVEEDLCQQPHYVEDSRSGPAQ